MSTTEKQKASSKKHRENHLETCKEKSRIASKKWRQAHPERANEIRKSPKGRWQIFKSKCNSRNLELSITFEQWCVLVIDKTCHYCDSTLISGGGSLDRKDSAIGYTLENVVACCGPCNVMKNNILSYEEMQHIMPILLKFRKRES
jgi:hypothetical protein